MVRAERSRLAWLVRIRYGVMDSGGWIVVRRSVWLAVVIVAVAGCTAYGTDPAYDEQVRRVGELRQERERLGCTPGTLSCRR